MEQPPAFTGSAPIEGREADTTMQIIVAWRVNKWVVERDAIEVGAYAYRAHALERARVLAAEARDAGGYLLIREQDGQWVERPLPKGGAHQEED